MNAPRPTLLVTGSAGLVGSAAVEHFHNLGWQVHGMDSNARRDFFGAAGDTAWNTARLIETCPHFVHHAIDLRDRPKVLDVVRDLRPGAVLHCAAQPSHDLAARRPFADFDTNAVGTLNLLEACQRSAREAPFVFLSTNKVYGDAPNAMGRVELPTRFDFVESLRAGVSETCPVDRCLHSLFGASKLAADVLVQEYGRYHGMATCCFRGGCLTGKQHAAVELHGFVAYLARAVRDGIPYRVYGYQGKQVRDQLHAADVCLAAEAFFARPVRGAVYNLGGGRPNSVSVLEAIDRAEQLAGRRLDWTYLDEARRGDHVVYYTDLRRFQADFPEWRVTRDLDSIFEEFFK